MVFANSYITARRPQGCVLRIQNGCDTRCSFFGVSLLRIAQLRFLGDSVLDEREKGGSNRPRCFALMRARIRHDKCGQLAALLGGVIVVLIAIRPVWLLGSATGSELAVGSHQHARLDPQGISKFSSSPG